MTEETREILEELVSTSIKHGVIFRDDFILKDNDDWLHFRLYTLAKDFVKAYEDDNKE